MKICIISTPVFPCPPSGYAGLEQIAWQQAEGLARRGHQVSLVAPDGSRCAGGEVIAFGPAGTLDEKTAYSRYWSRLRDFDAVVDHTWQKYSYTLKAEGVLKVPVLGVFHAPVNTMYQAWPPAYPAIGTIDKGCAVCISQDQAAHFMALHDRDVRVCHNGTDPEYYKAIPGLPRTSRFLFLARFSSIKGADIAIRACQEAGAELDLIGDTTITNEPDYLRQCQALCDGVRIKIHGGAPRGECVRWFSQAHALLHPNARFREPFGLAPVESMLCGTPCVAWRYGAMKETVKEGVSGWLVDSYEALVQRIRDCQITPLMREQARDWALRFSVEKMVDRMEELCIEAASSGGW
jgi:glycosyltransferase involved in cell wall biosynthesis